MMMVVVVVEVVDVHCGNYERMFSMRMIMMIMVMAVVLIEVVTI